MMVLKKTVNDGNEYNRLIRVFDIIIENINL